MQETVFTKDSLDRKKNNFWQLDERIIWRNFSYVKKTSDRQKLSLEYRFVPIMSL